MRAIDADALYERICDLEAQALSYVGKIGNDEAMRDKWRIWSAILAERTAFKHDVFDAPTIELKHEWIPCSERLPEHSKRYLVSVLDGIDRRTTVAPYLPRSRTWSLTGRMAYWKVIAWMPLPAPYEERREE